MPTKVYARRFAQAVFQIAQEKNELERWQSDLERIASIVSDVTVLAALENPKLKFNDKIGLFSKNLGDISPLALNLVRMLITRASIGMIGAIADEYRILLDDYQGVKSAEVVTAVSIDEKDKQKLAEELGALVGSRVTLKSGVDPEILGGIVARVGGKLLDGSTRSKLAAMKRQLGGRERKE
jgi:F-type H+-transporting ATPase subunit delta